MGSRYKKRFYDGHHREYNVGFALICDGYGMSRNIAGYDEGSCNDINIYQNSDWYKKPNDYFGNYKILADGIFRHVEGPFICSFPNVTNDEEMMFNVMHILARVMIEHVFGRQKAYWSIIDSMYTYNLKWIGLIYRNVALLTNMLVKHQSPMRK